MSSAATPPRDLGLEFEVDGAVVKIRAVDADGEGEAVGLIAGDVVVGIDGLQGTVEEQIAELCDDGRELRRMMMRIRRGGVVMAVKLFTDVVPELADDRADASTDALIAEFRKFAAAAPAPAVDAETVAGSRFGPRPFPSGMPSSDQQFLQSLGREISYQAADENYNAFGWLPNRGAL